MIIPEHLPLPQPPVVALPSVLEARVASIEELPRNAKLMAKRAALAGWQVVTWYARTIDHVTVSVRILKAHEEGRVALWRDGAFRASWRFVPAGMFKISCADALAGLR